MMPKALLRLAFLFVLAGVQPATAQRMGRLGLKLGGSLARYRGDNTAGGGSNNLVGFCGGAILNLPVSSVFSVQPELLFSQKGSKGQSFPVPSNMFLSGVERLTYAEVPVLVKLRTSAGPFVELGPTFSYLLSANASMNSPFGATATSSYDISSSFNAFEWGYAAGIGYQHKKGLLAGMRYSGGLSRIFKIDAFKASHGVSGETSAYNHALQLYVGLILFRRAVTEATFPQ
jgi:hypothetical protein